MMPEMYIAIVTLPAPLDDIFPKKGSIEYRNVCILPKHYKTVVIDFQLEIC